MALTGAAIEFAGLFEVANIPAKLRCAVCDKMALFAFRVECCDSDICGNCKESLDPEECPVCGHAPFKMETAKKANNHRTTIKIFLKNQAGKQGMDITGDTLKPIATAEAPPAPVVEAASTPAADSESAVAPADVQEPGSDREPAPGHAPETEIQSNAVNGNTEHTELNTAEGGQDEEDDDESDDDDVVITTERPYNEGQQHGHEQEQYGAQANENDMVSQNMSMNQQQSFGGGGFDQNMAGFGNANFANMAMGGYNPMMNMMSMGMPNMMGMGMGMDPSMMFNGGYGGMGDMSAMMGMGMNGMGMGDMSGMGNFGGMNGPGFFPNQGNYMQSQNFGNGQRQHFSYDRGYRGGRGGFGRGARGNFGRGRGGYGYQQQQYGGQHSDFPPNAPTGPSGARQQSGANATELANRRRSSPTYNAVGGSNGAATDSRDDANEQAANGVQESATDTNHAEDDTNAADEHSGSTQQNDIGAAPDTQGATQLGADQGEVANLEGAGQTMADDGAEMESVVVAEPSYGNFDEGAQYGHQVSSGHGGFRGRSGSGYGGYQGTDSTELTPKPAPPVNAPTGPKALRQGLPNTGWVSRASLPKPATTNPPAQRSDSQARSVEQSRHDIPYDRDMDARDQSTPRSGSKYRNRDGRERDFEDDHEDDEAYARRKERKRRERKERERKYEDEDRDEDSGSRKHRSRSESREDDGSRRRHRDKDEEHRPSRSHRDRSKDRHRSRRHRSKSPTKDYDDDHYSRRKSRRDDKYDDHSRNTRKGSRRDDDYEYEDSKKDRSSRSSRYDRERDRPRPVIEPPSDELGFKIKGSTKNKKDGMAPPSTFHRERSDRRGSAANESTGADPYAEERARAQQDREAKEAQRRQSTNDSRSSLGKRGRDFEDEPAVPTGPKGDRHRIKKSRKERRIPYKYEDEVQLS
ncbi:hypothetical protein CERZMDRAFT_94597 [Cercospora zeae-maydis SCOH1-5]|uniref:RING-type domain-containing protein n=1 Tax=Cercospora zeae-maydis SCOH1-5 TaxID=717836 RepID=A0A6A6FNZ5_9PEZI|nr:hypothetical protein CERZMDRAFT_94597 [Cercospora zeae-maydis SCOH1-5]